MTLPIISADERLAEKRGIKGCIFGKSGIGKTSLLWTLPADKTLFFDLEAGDLAIEGWAGDAISSNPALFTAVNKDTAEIYHELVPFDATLAQGASDRAVNLIQATEAGELLPRVAMSDDHFECVFCPYRGRCWQVPA